MEVTNFIGETGNYQNVILVLAMYRGIMLAVNNLCTSFMFPDVDHWCARIPHYSHLSLEEWKDRAIPQKSSGEYHKCLRYPVSKRGFNKSAGFFCHSWEYDHSEFWPSGTEKWNLVCDKAGLKAVPQFTYMLGMTVGFIFMGRISDMFGRRPVLLGGLVSYVIVEYAMALVSDFNLFCALRFFNAIAVAAANNSLTLYVESIGPSYRGRSMVAYGLFWGVGIALLAGLSAIVPGWQWQLAVYATMYALPLLLWRYIVESPKWLLTVGKYAKAEEAIRKIAKTNGRPELKEEEFTALRHYYREQRGSQEANGRSGLWALCKSKKMILFTFTNVIFQFCTAIVRYELALDTKTLPLGPYLNFVVGGVIEVASGLFSYAILLVMPRKRSTIFFLLSTTAAYVVHACVPKEYAAAEITTMLAGRLFIGNVININIIYLSEMFPTGARALAIGFAQTVFGIGAAVQPLIKHPFGNPTADAAFHAVILLFAAVAVLAWPETKNRPLPDFVANIETAGSSQSSNKSLNSTEDIEMASFRTPTQATDVSSTQQRAGAVTAAVASPAGAGVAAAGQNETCL